MRTLHVLAPVVLPRVPVRTEKARKGPRLVVKVVQMPIAVRRTRESFIALGTGEVLLAGVGTDVAQAAASPGKLGRTVRAAEGTFSAVDEHVLVEGGFPLEALVANVALVSIFRL